LPNAVREGPAGTRSRPPPTAIEPTLLALGELAVPVHSLACVVAEMAYTLPALPPTKTAPPLMTGAGPRVPFLNVHRLGRPDGSTATRLPFCMVYIFVWSKAGSVADVKVPTCVPEVFDRISGESKYPRT
jgi:hypothetical protein